LQEKERFDSVSNAIIADKYAVQMSHI